MYSKIKEASAGIVLKAFSVVLSKEEILLKYSHTAAKTAIISKLMVMIIFLIIYFLSTKIDFCIEAPKIDCIFIKLAIYTAGL